MTFSLNVSRLPSSSEVMIAGLICSRVKFARIYIYIYISGYLSGVTTMVTTTISVWFQFPPDWRAVPTFRKRLQYLIFVRLVISGQQVVYSCHVVM